MKLKFYILTIPFLIFSMNTLAESVVLEINKTTGDFTATNSSPTYYNEYATHNYSPYEMIPGVRIQHWGYNVHDNRIHFNNMYFYDGTHLGFYSSYTNPNYNYQVETRSESYRIYPSKGYYISAISFDFIPGQHPQFEIDGVRVWVNGDETSAVISPDKDTPGHFEAVYKPKDFNYDQPYIVLTVATQTEDSNPVFAHTYNFKVTITEYDNIAFADTNVKKICIDNWDTNGDGELSTDEAAAVTSFGTAFTGNTSITTFSEINHFTGLGRIDDNAFQGCTGLTSIEIPEGILSIGDAAFYGCTGLKSITILGCVNPIREYAFWDCINLTDIYCFSEIVPSMNMMSLEFNGNTVTLHVPESAIESYKNGSPWMYFKEIVALTDEELTAIKDIENGIDDADRKVIEFYDIGGQRLIRSAKGLNIIRSADGSTHKVLIK